MIRSGIKIGKSRRGGGRLFLPLRQGLQGLRQRPATRPARRLSQGQNPAPVRRAASDGPAWPAPMMIASNVREAIGREASSRENGVAD